MPQPNIENPAKMVRGPPSKGKGKGWSNGGKGGKAALSPREKGSNKGKASNPAQQAVAEQALVEH